MYVLYGGRYTRTSLVQMILEDGELSYELIELDMLAKEHRKPEYLQLNPAGFVPAMKTPEGEVLHETPAIMLYLAERHGLEHLAPMPGHALRGLFLTGVFYISNDIQPEIKRFYFPARYAGSKAQAPAIHDQAREMLIERFGVIEQRLAKAGPYYLGQRFSLVDLTIAFWSTSVFPQQALFEACPVLAAHCARVIEENACAHHIVSHQEASYDYWQNQLLVELGRQN